MHNEELYNLYASQSIIRVIKLKRMRLTAHVARIEKIHEYFGWKNLPTIKI